MEAELTYGLLKLLKEDKIIRLKISTRLRLRLDMICARINPDNVRTGRTVERTAVQPLTLHPTTQIQQSTLNLSADVRMILPGDISSAETTQTSGQIGK